MLFRKKEHIDSIPFDPDRQRLAVRKSICTGEMTLGLIDRDSGTFHDIMQVDQEMLLAICRHHHLSPQDVSILY